MGEEGVGETRSRAAVKLVGGCVEVRVTARVQFHVVTMKTFRTGRHPWTVHVSPHPRVVSVRWRGQAWDEEVCGSQP